MCRILPNKEYWSPEELKELEEEWKSVGEYEDVVASHIQDCQTTVKKCPNGCNLTVNEPNYHDEGWYIASYDFSGRRKTVFCRKHRYARIYVISENNYKATKDNCNNNL